MESERLICKSMLVLVTSRYEIWAGGPAFFRVKPQVVEK